MNAKQTHEQMHDNVRVNYDDNAGDNEYEEQ